MRKPLCSAIDVNHLAIDIPGPRGAKKDCDQRDILGVADIAGRDLSSSPVLLRLFRGKHPLINLLGMDSSATSCKSFFRRPTSSKAATFLVEQSSDRASNSATSAGNESDFIGQFEIHDVAERNLLSTQ
jgi:hypothetical protein